VNPTRATQGELARASGRRSAREKHGPKKGPRVRPCKTRAGYGWGRARGCVPSTGPDRLVATFPSPWPSRGSERRYRAPHARGGKRRGIAGPDRSRARRGRQAGSAAASSSRDNRRSRDGDNPTSVAHDAIPPVDHFTTTLAALALGPARPSKHCLPSFLPIRGEREPLDSEGTAGGLRGLRSPLNGFHPAAAAGPSPVREPRFRGRPAPAHPPPPTVVRMLRHGRDG